MRIDRSESADELGDADVSRRIPSAPDTRPDSAPRPEEVTAYHAKVDAVYRQDAISDNDHSRQKGELTEVAFSRKSETLQAPDGDTPDDPRNHSNLKKGRFDASWSAYDLAIAAAREHTGGNLGADSIKMYDYNPKTGEGTGTLIGEQTPDRLRGWRIDGKDGHVNWWDWTGGKKGAGGMFGHDWFPEDPSVPGSRYIGWAPWQDNDGNILDGN